MCPVTIFLLLLFSSVHGIYFPAYFNESKLQRGLVCIRIKKLTYFWFVRSQIEKFKFGLKETVKDKLLFGSVEVSKNIHEIKKKT